MTTHDSLIHAAREDPSVGPILADHLDDHGMAGGAILRAHARTRANHPVSTTGFRSRLGAHGEGVADGGGMAWEVRGPLNDRIIGEELPEHHRIGSDSPAYVRVWHYLQEKPTNRVDALWPKSVVSGSPVFSLSHAHELTADWPEEERQKLMRALKPLNLPETHEDEPTRLARMKAPAKGAIVNNQFAKGGQFLAAACARIRDVAARLKLARPKKVAPTPRPHSTDPLAILAHHDIALRQAFEESITKRELLKLEAAFGHPDELKLSAHPGIVPLGLDDRLVSASSHPSIAQEMAFVNHMTRRTLSDAQRKDILRNKKVPPGVRAAFLAAVSAESVRRYMGAFGHAGNEDSPAGWYQKAMDPLDVALHTRHADKVHDPQWGSVDWNRAEGPKLRYEGKPVWEHAPAQTVARALIGVTSPNRQPPDNADMMDNIVAEGKVRAHTAGHTNWVKELPDAQHATIRKWREETGLPDPGIHDTHGSHWDAMLAWEKAHHDRMWARATRVAQAAGRSKEVLKKDAVGYSSTGVYTVPGPGGERHVVAKVPVGNAPPIFIGDNWGQDDAASLEANKRMFEQAKARGTLQKSDSIPLVNEAGELVPKSVSSMSSIPAGIRTVKRLAHVIEARPEIQKIPEGHERTTAILRAMSHWFVVLHPVKEIEDVMNHPSVDGPELHGKSRRRIPEEGGYLKTEYRKPGGMLPGAFMFGPKTGPFTMNTHGNTPVPPGEAADYWLKYLTDDVWHTRGTQLYEGAIRTKDGKMQGDQPTSSVRSPRFAAAKEAVKSLADLGIEHPGQFQAVHWVLHQSLPRIFGTPVDSLTFTDAANHLMRKAGAPHIQFAASGRLKWGRKVKPTGLAAPERDTSEDTNVEPALTNSKAPDPRVRTKGKTGLATPERERPERLSRPASRPLHVAYVSPNQKEGTTFLDAARGIADADMQALERQTPGGQSGYGFWKDGAEQTRIIPVSDPADLPHTAAGLGLTYNQKNVLWFEDKGSGPDALHVLNVPETDAEKIHNDLFRHGVEYKTVIPNGPHGSTVHVVDSGDGADASVEAYAKEARASAHEKHYGTAECPGAEDRKAAAQIFQKILSAPVTRKASSDRSSL